MNGYYSGNLSRLTSRVIWAPIKTPQLTSTVKTSVFEFLGLYDRYVNLFSDGVAAGEVVTGVDLSRCIEPDLLDFFG